MPEEFKEAIQPRMPIKTEEEVAKAKAELQNTLGPWGPSENVDWTNKKALNSILTEAENGLIFGNDRKAALEKIVELAQKALK